MRWIRWRTPANQTEPGDAVDVDRALATGMQDRAAARQSISRLQQERSALLRRRRAVETGYKRLSRARTRLIKQSSSSVDMQVYQFSEALRDANTAEQAGIRTKEHVAAIDAQVHAIDEALTQLRPVARGRGRSDP